ncbi:UNVERIFIED_CONTAM: maleylacetate reductase, partial [Kocuria sp. CPCC 205295]
MSLEFTHTTLPQRVLFGAGRGAQHLEAEVQRLSAQRVMVIAGQRELEMARQIAARIDVALWHDE